MRGFIGGIYNPFDHRSDRDMCLYGQNDIHFPDCRRDPDPVRRIDDTDISLLYDPFAVFQEEKGKIHKDRKATRKEQLQGSVLYDRRTGVSMPVSRRGDIKIEVLPRRTGMPCFFEPADGKGL